MKDVALMYAGLGWNIFPCHTAKDGKCSCGNQKCKRIGKHPRNKNGVNGATKDITEIEGWWDRWPDANIALACGEISGVLVVDSDNGNGKYGDESLETLEQQLGKLPPTVESITGGGGRHLLLKYPSGVKILNKVGLVNGIDVRSNGGYIILPPSMHKSGKKYEWEASSSPLDGVATAELPEPWVNFLKEREVKNEAPEVDLTNLPKGLSQRAQKYAAKTHLDLTNLPKGLFQRAQKYAAKMPPAISGQGGHNATFKVAVAMVRGFVLDFDQAMNIMQTYSQRCIPPWSDKELRHKVNSAILQSSVPLGYLVNFPDGEKTTPNPTVEAAATVEAAVAPNPTVEAAAAATVEAAPNFEPGVATDPFADLTPLAPGESIPFSVQSTASSVPIIVIDENEKRVVEESIQALYQANAPIVSFRGELCRIRESVNTSLETVLSVEKLPLPQLQQMMASTANWVATNRKGTLEPKHPPDWAVKQVETQPDWPFKGVKTTSDTPVMLPDGSIIYERGLNEKSGLFLTTSCKIDDVKENPTQSDAMEAVLSLLEIVEDFPFKEDTHRSAWVAAFLTPLARHMYIGPSPITMIDATTRGSGKTMLADCIGYITTGAEFPRMSQAKDEEEERKRITAIAAAGTSCILLDNLTKIGSTALDAAMTSTMWTDRMLGQTKQVTFPLMTTWYATGNNVRIQGDMSRRILHVRLETQEENPEYRSQFKHPELINWIIQERPRLLACAFTILRASLLNKEKENLPTWGSYIGWSNVVRQAVVFAGLPDPISANACLEESDEDRLALADFIDAWRSAQLELMQEKGMSSRDVSQMLTASRWSKLKESIQSLLPAKTTSITARDIGYILRRHRGRIVEGRKFVSKTLHGNIVWTVDVVVPENVPVRAESEMN
jgi:hypothetical protein